MEKKSMAPAIKKYQYSVTKVKHHEDGRVQVYSDAGTLEVENFEAAMSHINVRVSDFPGIVVELNVLAIK